MSIYPYEIRSVARLREREKERERERENSQKKERRPRICQRIEIIGEEDITHTPELGSR